MESPFKNFLESEQFPGQTLNPKNTAIVFVCFSSQIPQPHISAPIRTGGHWNNLNL
jgi:hypothetical protein